MTQLVRQASKAVVAGVLAGLSALSAYLVNNTGIGDLTAGQWVQVAIAVIVTASAVYGVPNKTTGG